MSRLVVISNRLADPRKSAAGGLAVALGDALARTGGLWFGWSGTVTADGTPGEGALQTHQAGNVTLATVDLCQADHAAYYQGYANSVLWPVLHYRLDLADFSANYSEGYRRVNQMFARKLLPLLREDDVIWVHDYHLIPLAAELRALGCRQRIGFFLHVPVPPPLILAALPQHEWLMRSFFAYDLVGLQSEADVVHFTRYMVNEAHAQELDGQRLRAFNATVRVAAFPIGIDVQEFQRLGRAPDAVQTCEALRAEYSRRQLLLGIDRLDYSKGIPHRVRAFRQLLERYPENEHSATLVMIASPSRDDVHAYADLRQELEGLCGAINGDYGDLDWMPLRYIHRTVARKRVPGLCRAAR
ncbi:MAG: alpha,alpha-trehalose-phosphate synthase (UDP-forming), partial [Diaphorobacter nitroreducens]